MIVFLLLLIFLFPSCSQSVSVDREIYLVSVADDFYGWNGSKAKLDTVVSDQAALITQFQTFGDVHVTAFVSQNGKRYVSTTPVFVPSDKLGSKLERASDPRFHSFLYSPKLGETEEYWDMKTVLGYLEGIPSGGDDLVVFVYSGHGEEETGNLLTNASPDSDTYETMGVGNILDALENMGGRKILILDSCYSGFFVPETGLSGMDRFSDERKVKLMDSSHLNALGDAIRKRTGSIGREDLWVMASATSGQEALDSIDYMESPFQRSYGAFTFYLLEAMGYDMWENEARRPEERITFYSLYSRIRRSYPEEELEFQTPQASRKMLDVILN